MRSIRLSLIVYFLVLLAGALGVIGALAYRRTQQTLRDKEASMRELLVSRHAGQCQAVRAEWDDRIVRRAQTLASLAQSQFGSSRYHELPTFGLLTAGLQSNGHVLVPMWLAEVLDGRLAQRLRRLPSVQIQFAEEVLTRDGDGRECFSVFGETGRPLQRSATLADGALTLEASLREKLGLFEWSFDDIALDGVPWRRVTLKVPVSRFRMHWSHHGPKRPPGPPSLRPPGPVGLWPVPPPPETMRGIFDRAAPAIFIQCASDCTARDTTLADLDADLNHDLADLESVSHATLTDLRRRLLATGLITFIATVVGGFWLVSLGLKPLQRLSLAVSQVSEKDFRLPLDRAQLPHELRPIAERLARTLESLQRAFAREKQAAADISHELRTPLAALLATTDVALRKPRSTDEYRELLADCRVSGLHMGQLVERLLTLARVDSGADPLRLEELDVAALTEECVAMARPLAEAHGLLLHLHCPQPLRLRTDAAKLREILGNLLHNAVEYTPMGRIDVRVFRHKASVRIEVCDTGIGIAAGERERIFERFYRADPSRQADGLHAGLGLAISKSYVELLGGVLAVDSAEGQGSTFRVDLPCSTSRGQE